MIQQAARAIKIQPQILQRNKKIASIMTFLITIAAKIERLKEKLCGFSSMQFSPEIIFEALDLTNKGYLDLYDIRQFLGNDNIHDQEILILFSRLGDVNKMTYIGYLSLLRPYFNHELARDMLLRDTISKKMSHQHVTQQMNETNEAVLILLNELILMHCICISEHQELKNALSDEYMLNGIELGEILGFYRKNSALKAIHQFIDFNGEYSVQEGEVKYLLSYLQTNELSITTEKCLNYLFSPSKSFAKSSNQPIKEGNKTNRQNQQFHANYMKPYIGKNQLLLNSNRFSFLNYIHPNSETQPTQKYKKRSDNKKQLQQQGKKHGHQHNQSGSKYQKKINFHLAQNEKLDQSIVQPSKLYRQKLPFSYQSQLRQHSLDKFDTPILEQFMHQKNLKINLGHYKSSLNPNALNSLMQQSSKSGLQESNAIERVDYPSISKPQINQVSQAKRQHNNIFPQSRVGNLSRQINYSQNTFENENRSILGQFLKSQFR